MKKLYSAAIMVAFLLPVCQADASPKMTKPEVRRMLDATNTPYGSWAVPSYVVSCESHFQRWPAGNPTDSYYQVIPSTWGDMLDPSDGDGVALKTQRQLRRVGSKLKGTPAATPLLGQHVVADEIRRTSGLSQWSCA